MLQMKGVVPPLNIAQQLWRTHGMRINTKRTKENPKGGKGTLGVLGWEPLSGAVTSTIKTEFNKHIAVDKVYNQQ